MPTQQGFTRDEMEHLGYYVYFLQDPSNDEIFYVGEGKDNWVLDHIEHANEKEWVNRRLDKIREIEARGEEVKCFVVRHGMDKQTAQEVEGALIDVLLFRDQDGLTNKQRGKDSRNRGLWDFRGHISGGSGFHMPPTTEVNERPDRVIDILKQLVNNFCWNNQVSDDCRSDN